MSTAPAQTVLSGREPRPAVSPAPESWPEMLERVARAGGRLLLTPQLTPCGTTWFYVRELVPERPGVRDFVVIDGIAAIGSNR